MTRSLLESLGGRSPDQWALDFLAQAHLPATPANVQVVVSWEYAESGSGGGMFNPLNTTQGGYPRETDFNRVGVKNFATYIDGIAANARVLRNGFYARVVDAFERGNDPRTICDLITMSPWGTGMISLVGTPIVPTPIVGDEMQLIASPHKPIEAGRQAAATWSPTTPNVVVCTNGASIEHDAASGPGARVWRPPIPPGKTGVGIMATVDRKGRTDGRGIVIQDSNGDTYVGLWS